MEEIHTIGEVMLLVPELWNGFTSVASLGIVFLGYDRKISVKECYCRNLPVY